jgi:hypothetical protein
MNGCRFGLESTVGGIAVEEGEMKEGKRSRQIIYWRSRRRSEDE